MPSDAAQKHRTHLTLLLVVAAGAAIGGCFAASRTGAPAHAERDILTYDTTGFRYEYQVVTGRESLFENCTGTRRFVDVSAGHAGTVAACRRALAEELGVSELSVLRRPDVDRDEIARLRAIGYL